MRAISLVALGLLSSLTAAHAGTVTAFSDRATFEAGFNSVSTEDFGPYSGSASDHYKRHFECLNVRDQRHFHSQSWRHRCRSDVFNAHPGGSIPSTSTITHFFGSGVILSSVRGTSTNFYGDRNLTVSFDTPQAGFGFDTSLSYAKLRCHHQLRGRAEPDFSYAFSTPPDHRRILSDLLRLGEFGGGHHLGSHRFEPIRHDRPELCARQFHVFGFAGPRSCGPAALRLGPRWFGSVRLAPKDKDSSSTRRLMATGCSVRLSEAWRSAIRDTAGCGWCAGRRGHAPRSTAARRGTPRPSAYSGRTPPQG